MVVIPWKKLRLREESGRLGLDQSLFFHLFLKIQPTVHLLLLVVQVIFSPLLYYILIHSRIYSFLFSKDNKWQLTNQFSRCIQYHDESHLEKSILSKSTMLLSGLRCFQDEKWWVQFFTSSPLLRSAFSHVIRKMAPFPNIKVLLMYFVVQTLFSTNFSNSRRFYVCFLWATYY